MLFYLEDLIELRFQQDNPFLPHPFFVGCLLDCLNQWPCYAVIHKPPWYKGERLGAFSNIHGGWDGGF
jgi:hypothetical protein